MNIMTSKVWTKTQTQQTIKVLRDNGLPVKKITGGYLLEMTNKQSGKKDLLFRAMTNKNSYLVRYNKNLFIGSL